MTELCKEMQSLKSDLLQQMTDNKTELQESFKSTSHDIREEILIVRNHVLNLLLKENRGLRQRVQTLESRVLDIEKAVIKSEQNGRKSNFELDGIPTNIRHDKLASTVTDIVNSVVDKKIDIADVEACHRLPGKKTPAPTIIRMKRNIIDEVWKNKKKLAGIDKKLDFPEGTKIFINHNLSSSMKSISFNARKLLSAGIIAETWFSNAAVRIKHLDGTVARIDHEMDLYSLFPSFNFSFDTSMYDRVLNTDIEDYDYLHDYDDPRASVEWTPSGSGIIDEVLKKMASTFS